MARTALSDLPKHNPCAQCGQPIALPEWVEETPGRVAYLWHCHACDYRFEAVAFFADEHRDGAFTSRLVLRLQRLDHQLGECGRFLNRRRGCRLGCARSGRFVGHGRRRFGFKPNNPGGVQRAQHLVQ